MSVWYVNVYQRDAWISYGLPNDSLAMSDKLAKEIGGRIYRIKCRLKGEHRLVTKRYDEHTGQWGWET